MCICVDCTYILYVWMLYYVYIHRSLFYRALLQKRPRTISMCICVDCTYILYVWMLDCVLSIGLFFIGLFCKRDLEPYQYAYKWIVRISYMCGCSIVCISIGLFFIGLFCKRDLEPYQCAYVWIVRISCMCGCSIMCISIGLFFIGLFCKRDL